jgi:hypothetical protein
MTNQASQHLSGIPYDQGECFKIMTCAKAHFIFQNQMRSGPGTRCTVEAACTSIPWLVNGMARWCKCIKLGDRRIQIEGLVNGREAAPTTETSWCLWSMFAIKCKQVSLFYSFRFMYITLRIEHWLHERMKSHCFLIKCPDCGRKHRKIFAIPGGDRVVTQLK